MKFVDLFKLSTRMFKARTSRTLLTILGMSIGIAAILFLVSLGYGLQKTLLERITTADSLLTLDVSEAKSAAVALDNEMIKSIENLSGVEQVSPAFQVTAQGHLDSFSADLVIIGAKPSFLKLGGYNPTEGSLLTDNEQNGIVISSSVVQVFDKDPKDIIGKEMDFTFFVPKNQEQQGENEGTVRSEESYNVIESDRKYKIIGIIEGQDNIIYINFSALGNLNIKKYDQLKVKTRSNEEMTVIRDTILSFGLLVSSLSETVDDANKIFGVLQVILLLFGVIALIVSAIGMFNTMTITLLERTEEIGIMKSIGASDEYIHDVFMESAIWFLGRLRRRFNWMVWRIHF